MQKMCVRKQSHNFLPDLQDRDGVFTYIMLATTRTTTQSVRRANLRPDIQVGRTVIYPLKNGKQKGDWKGSLVDRHLRDHMNFPQQAP